MADSPTYATREEVDFVVIGSGSAGGILAKELSTAGLKTVVLEQGPYRKQTDFTHDEIDVMLNGEFGDGGPRVNGQTFRDDESKEATSPPSGFLGGYYYAQTVGGSGVQFSANFLRMREIDFMERSVLGPIDGTNFADWPISYEELEPYYSKVDWDVGVSGAPGHFDAPRSRDFPMPPMTINSSGALMAKGAAALGLHADVQPHAIVTKVHNGRAPCTKCGFCMFYGCEMGAKSSSLAAMIPLAEASGNCEIRAECAAFRIKTDASGRATEVLYYDADGNEQAQRTKAVVLSANGVESPRLLLMSANERQPDGLGNSSGYVGRNLMLNSHAFTSGIFEHTLNEFKGVQATRVVQDFYETDPKRGYFGGGGIDARAMFAATPLMYAMAGSPPDIKQWGGEFKNALAHNFSRQMGLAVSGTSLPMDRNNITLDPNNTDQWGRQSVRMTYRDHPDDLANVEFMRDRAMEILDAAGAVKAWSGEIGPSTGGVHLLGTCRMGDDPTTSVVDKYNRSHDVANLFICDGSSLVSSTRGQPTMTIMALAFRAAENIIKAAGSGDI
ncbi:MAG: GMC family oxidoreductase [Woeseiaceae bacterium]